MAKINRIEKIYEEHYKDMFELNKRFIRTMERPKGQIPGVPSSYAIPKTKLSKKQLKALSEGRKKLALKRSNVLQI